MRRQALVRVGRGSRRGVTVAGSTATRGAVGSPKDFEGALAGGGGDGTEEGALVVPGAPFVEQDLVASAEEGAGADRFVAAVEGESGGGGRRARGRGLTGSEPGLTANSTALEMPRRTRFRR